MARRLNTRLLVYLLISAGVPVAVLLIAIFSGWGRGLLGRGDPAQLYEQAKVHMEKKEWAEAYNKMTRAAGLDPDNAEMQYQLGYVAMRTTPPQVGAARKAFANAVALKPDYFEAQRDLTELQIVLRDWRAATAAVGDLIRIKPDYDRSYIGGAHVAMAQAEAEPTKGGKLPHYEEAVKYLEKGVENVPASIQVYAMLAHVYERLEQQDKAEEVFERAIRNNPTEPDAYGLKASHLLAKDQADEAVAVLKGGLEKIPASALLHLMLGEVAMQQRQFDAAREYFAKGLDLDPEKETGYLRLASLYRMENEPDKALELLNKAGERLPDSTLIKTEKADIYLERKEFEQAEALIAELDKAEPGSGSVSYLRGKRALIDRQVRQAVQHLRDARAKQPTGRARLLLGRALYAANELGDAQRELRELLALDPGAVAARRTLAEVQLRLREFDQAVRNATTVLQAEREDAATRMVLAQALLALNRLDAALQEGQTAADQLADDPRPLLLVAAIQEEMKSPAQAEATLLRAKALGKEQEAVYQTLAQFYRGTKQADKLKALAAEARPLGVIIIAGDEKPEDVERQLRAFLAQEPENPGRMLALARFLVLTQREGEAIEVCGTVLAKAELGSPPWREAWQLTFMKHLQDGAFEAASKLIEQLRQVDEQAPELYFADPLLDISQNRLDLAAQKLRAMLANNPTSAAWFLLGQILAEQQKLDEARTAFQQAVELRPNMIAAHLMLARLQLRQGNYAGALMSAGEALNYRPGLLAALELKAAAHVGAGDLDSAIATHEQITKVTPDDPRNFAMLAALYLRRQIPEKAEEAFKRAYALRPEEPLIVQSLAEFYAMTDRRPQGEAVIDTYIAAHPDKPAGYYVRAEFLARFATIEAAEPHYRKAFQVKPDDPTPLLRLGDQYSLKRAWEQAEAVYKEVIAAFKDNDVARKRLADVYMLQRKLDEAEALVNDLLKGSPDDAQAWVIRGRIAGRRGDFSGARALLQKAMDMQREYGEARFWLAELISAKEPEEATRLLDMIDPADPSFEKAMLLRAAVDIRRGLARDAIHTLTRLLRYRPNSVPGRRALAERHMFAKEYGRAAEILGQLVMEQKDAELLVRLGEALLEDRQGAAALQRFEQARAMQPEFSDALEGEVRCLVALNRKDDALRRIYDVMNRYPDEAWPRLALARYFELVGDPAKAIEALDIGLTATRIWEEGYIRKTDLFLRLAEQNPASREALHQQAYQTLVAGLQVLPASTPMRTMLAGLEMERNRHESAAQILAPVAEAFRARYSRQPEELPELRGFFPAVRLYSISLYMLAKVDEAIEWSTLVYDIEPTEVTVANNLGWMLATEKKELDRATAIIRRAMQLVPNNPQILDTWGWIAYLKGDYQQAVESFLRSIQLGDSPEARYHLGRTYEVRERFAEAREQYQKALDLNLRGKDREDAERRLKELPAAS